MVEIVTMDLSGAPLRPQNSAVQCNVTKVTKSRLKINEIAANLYDFAANLNIFKSHDINGRENIHRSWCSLKCSSGTWWTTLYVSIQCIAMSPLT